MTLRRFLPGLAAVLLVLAGCGGSGNGKHTVNWWTWDERQAAAYKQCIPEFEKAHPDVTVKISQYDVADYFTKLTADFVAENAPDAFMNSVQYFPTYVEYKQLQPLNDYLSPGSLARFDVGVDAWKGKDGQQYGLPMDWASAGIYYNRAAIKQAGYTDSDMRHLTWNPSNGGTFQKVAAHLTIDRNGVRGDQPGFDRKHIKVYGTGVLGAADFLGQTSWFPFAASTGWTLGSAKSWPKKFNYTDKRFVATMDWVKSMVAKGYAPAYNQFTVADSEQLGGGKVAMTLGGSWEATTFSALKGVSVGTARTVMGPIGRRTISGANGNVMWSGSHDKQATWEWMTYQESAACQTRAALYNGSFFPSIGSAMSRLAAQEKAHGTDLSAFTGMEKSGELELQHPYDNGSDMQAKLIPLFENYFSNHADDSVWAKAEKTSQDVIGASPG